MGIYRVIIKKGFEIFQFEFSYYSDASGLVKTLLLSSTTPIEVAIDYIKPRAPETEDIKTEN